MSEDATAGAEKFQDAMTNLRAVATGVRNRALGPLLEQLTPLIKQFGAWVSENRELIATRIDEFLERAANMGRFLARQWQNGTIPAVLAGVAAFKGISAAVYGAQGVLVAIQAVKQAIAAGGILAAVNPITAAIGALAVAAGLIIKYWEPIKAFFRGLWQGITQSFQNAWARIRPIVEAVTRGAQAIGALFGGGGEEPAAAGAGGGSITGREMGGGRRGAEMYPPGSIERSTVTENRSTVSVDFNNVPQGTRIRQQGQAPGVSLNTAYGLSGL
jgi:hypothetical protein